MPPPIGGGSSAYVPPRQLSSTSSTIKKKAVYTVSPVQHYLGRQSTVLTPTPSATQQKSTVLTPTPSAKVRKIVKMKAKPSAKVEKIPPPKRLMKPPGEVRKVEPAKMIEPTMAGKILVAAGKLRKFRIVKDKVWPYAKELTGYKTAGYIQDKYSRAPTISIRDSAPDVPTGRLYTKDQIMVHEFAHMAQPAYAEQDVIEFPLTDSYKKTMVPEKFVKSKVEGPFEKYRGYPIYTPKQYKITYPEEKGVVSIREIRGDLSVPTAYAVGGDVAGGAKEILTTSQTREGGFSIAYPEKFREKAPSFFKWVDTAWSGSKGLYVPKGDGREEFYLTPEQVKEVKETRPDIYSTWKGQGAIEILDVKDKRTLLPAMILHPLTSYRTAKEGLKYQYIGDKKLSDVDWALQRFGPTPARSELDIQKYSTKLEEAKKFWESKPDLAYSLRYATTEKYQPAAPVLPTPEKFREKLDIKRGGKAGDLLETYTERKYEQAYKGGGKVAYELGAGIYEIPREKFGVPKFGEELLIARGTGWLLGKGFSILSYGRTAVAGTLIKKPAIRLAWLRTTKLAGILGGGYLSYTYFKDVKERAREREAKEPGTYYREFGREVPLVYQFGKGMESAMIKSTLVPKVELMRRIQLEAYKPVGAEEVPKGVYPEKYSQDWLDKFITEYRKPKVEEKPVSSATSKGVKEIVLEKGKAIVEKGKETTDKIIPKFEIFPDKGGVLEVGKVEKPVSKSLIIKRETASALGWARANLEPTWGRELRWQSKLETGPGGEPYGLQRYGEFKREWIATERLGEKESLLNLQPMDIVTGKIKTAKGTRLPVREELIIKETGKEAGAGIGGSHSELGFVSDIIKKDWESGDIDLFYGISRERVLKGKPTQPPPKYNPFTKQLIYRDEGYKIDFGKLKEGTPEKLAVSALMRLRSSGAKGYRVFGSELWKGKGKGTKWKGEKVAEVHPEIAYPSFLGEALRSPFKLIEGTILEKKAYELETKGVQILPPEVPLSRLGFAYPEPYVETEKGTKLVSIREQARRRLVGTTYERSSKDIPKLVKAEVGRVARQIEAEGGRPTPESIYYRLRSLSQQYITEKYDIKARAARQAKEGSVLDKVFIEEEIKRIKPGAKSYKWEPTKVEKGKGEKSGLSEPARTFFKEMGIKEYKYPDTKLSYPISVKGKGKEPYRAVYKVPYIYKPEYKPGYPTYPKPKIPYPEPEYPYEGPYKGYTPYGDYTYNYNYDYGDYSYAYEPPLPGGGLIAPGVGTPDVFGTGLQPKFGKGVEKSYRYIPSVSAFVFGIKAKEVKEDIAQWSLGIRPVIVGQPLVGRKEYKYRKTII